MAWCHLAPSHYLNQCWQRSMSPYGVTHYLTTATVVCVCPAYSISLSLMCCPSCCSSSSGGGCKKLLLCVVLPLELQSADCQTSLWVNSLPGSSVGKLLYIDMNIHNFTKDDICNIYDIYIQKYQILTMGNVVDIQIRCNMSFIEPMHRNKPNIAYFSFKLIHLKKKKISDRVINFHVIIP